MPQTTLLLHLAMTAILMRDAKDSAGVSVDVAGKEQTVIWVECGGRNAPIRRLATLLRGHLSSTMPAAEDDLLDTLIDQCLARFVVYRPTSTTELAATIQALPDLFMAMDDATPELGYVLIDGMSEFAWADQLASERGKDADTTGSPNALRRLVAAIANLRNVLAPVTFISQIVVRPSAITDWTSDTLDGRLPFYRHHLVAPWPSISQTTIPSAASTTSFTFAFHISTHAPEPEVIQPRTTMQAALAARQQGLREGTAGFRAVVRRAGGQLVGEWSWENTPTSVYA